MKVKVVEKNNIPKMVKACKELNKKEITVGIDNGELEMLAQVHEYGCRIPVTPKMRAFLHSKGLHLKKSTKFIVIPERSFIRAGYDQNERKYLNKLEDNVCKGIIYDSNLNAILEAHAEELADIIADYATDLRNPKNHPFTVSEKGSANPLVDTGRMIGAIKGRVD